MSHEEYRFTLDDEHAIAVRISEVLSLWRGQSPATWKPAADHLETLYRSGCNAIGCSDADLRQVEREWVRSQVAYASGLSTADLRADASRTFEEASS